MSLFGLYLSFQKCLAQMIGILNIFVEHAQWQHKVSRVEKTR